MKTRIRISILIPALVVLGSAHLFGQMDEGFFLKAGFNTAYPEWENYNVIVEEYNSLRPNLTTTLNMGKTFMGVHLGYGVSFEKRFYAEMIYMSNRNLMRYEEVTSGTVTDHGTFTLVHRGLTINGGLNLVETEKFRIGIFAGIGGYPVVFRKIGKDFKQTFFTYLLVPLLAMRNNPSSIDEKFYMGSTIGANIQIGGLKGVVIEPYYNFSFWEVNAKSTRDALNPNTPSAYPNDKFKNNMAHWGIRFSFFIGARP